MTQLRIWDYGAPRKSEYLNDHFVGVVPTKRVYRGYNVAETGPASLNLDINIDPTGSSVLMTEEGVRIEETANILNAVTIAPHATLDRIDWILAAHEYTGDNNPQTYEVLEGTAGAPPLPPAAVPAHKVLLATVYVPAGATVITNDLINISERITLGNTIDRSGFIELRPDPQSALNNTVFVNGGTYVKSDGTDVVTVVDDVASALTFPPVTAPGQERYDLLGLDDTGTAVIVPGVEAASGLGDAPAYPTDKQIIAEVFIDEPAAVSISQQDIRDVRFFFNLGGGGGGGGSAHLYEKQVASASQTVFSLTTGTYAVGSDTLLVFRNGKKLTNVDEYTETNSTTVTLLNPATLGDVLQFIVPASNGALVPHNIEFHSDGAEMMAPGQTYRDLVIDCASATQATIKQNTKVLSDDWETFINVASDITADITVSGANGLDTGSEAINTWYYLYLIKNVTTSTVASLLSVSPTAPTLPAGYTKKRLIGAIRNDGAGDFLLFDQVNLYVQYDVGHLLYNALNNNWVPISASSYLPPLSRKMTAAGSMASNSDILIRLRPSGQLNKGLITSGDQQMSCTCEFLTDPSQGFSIYSGSAVPAAISLYIQAYEINL